MRLIFDDKAVESRPKTDKELEAHQKNDSYLLAKNKIELQNNLINACKWILWAGLGFVVLLLVQWCYCLLLDKTPSPKLEHVLGSLGDWIMKIFIGWSLGSFFKRTADGKQS